MNVGFVHPQNVCSTWKDVGPLLQKALSLAKKERLDAVDIMEMCINGSMMLWICVDNEDGNKIKAAFTTQVIVYPKYKALSVQYMGGTAIRRWFPEAMRVMKRFARDAGCETIEGYGREAWIRYIGQHGFSRVYTAFEVDLTAEDVQLAAE